MSDSCGDLSASFTINCSKPLQAGTADNAWVINFDDISAVSYNIANPEIVEDIVLASGKSAFLIEGKNNSIEPSESLVKAKYSENFDHSVGVIVFQNGPTIKQQLNKAPKGRFVIITENKYKGASGESAFEVRGLTSGLIVT